MLSKEESLKWLGERMEEYRSAKDGIGEVVEDFDDMGKIGNEFMSSNELEGVDIGCGGSKRPTYVNSNPTEDQKKEMLAVFKEFAGCFAWSYTEMPNLSKELVEHRLLIKRGFKPYKQLARNFNLKIIGRIKEEVDQLLQARFIRPCRYAEWVSNVVLMEKKNNGKIRVCIDYRNLNRATPKDEYPMSMVDLLINTTSGNKVISFLDGNA
jgi:hypothetical protein